MNRLGPTLRQDGPWAPREELKEGYAEAALGSRGSSHRKEPANPEDAVLGSRGSSHRKGPANPEDATLFRRLLELDWEAGTEKGGKKKAGQDPAPASRK